ncbi:uncharacterized protein LOC132740631 [Ruditapes philippinarum]|uniref:uncharacterized protein LOC132740631 n=1 Tax=Ruditapes philippinarum TaxID=129788 RepID=UPI00295B04E2|nr:uncharacterized protein LOC132740631 [Ruditapes philippinarum]
MISTYFNHLQAFHKARNIRVELFFQELCNGLVMDVLRLGIYFLSAVSFVECFKYTAAIVLKVQDVTAGVPSENMIECAFKLMKTSDKSFVRIAAGTELCEQLARPLSNYSSFFEEGYEYYEKSVYDRVYEIPNPYKEKVSYYIYSEVKIGDKFNFVFRKMSTDTLYITFKNTTKINVLIFDDDSVQLSLNDKRNSHYGEVVKPAYPFHDFKTYTIIFEVVELHWKISINGKVLTMFDHRQSLQHITMIVVKYGPSMKYLSKAFDPRDKSIH